MVARREYVERECLAELRRRATEAADAARDGSKTKPLGSGTIILVRTLAGLVVHQELLIQMEAAGTLASDESRSMSGVAARIARIIGDLDLADVSLDAEVTF